MIYELYHKPSYYFKQFVRNVFTGGGFYIIRHTIICPGDRPCNRANSVAVATNLNRIANSVFKICGLNKTL